ncbi:hypothetical protein BU26DRAFT_320158 [Trematosphaeria pertusa]|uniref:Uncharacterized protein n=1 Tax=Trematosphaeria pertusa TaxID=390896 RepID=A0A6A6IG51_9PLEO|nr:uncharacterized protein BU26DRAFT_320158 [Trematosphaeria pertusa]KAF2249564.1 hypothetical protein BU26DRAFT_320158 [Trematosphaeria pertusa]
MPSDSNKTYLSSLTADIPPPAYARPDHPLEPGASNEGEPAVTRCKRPTLEKLLAKLDRLAEQSDVEPHVSEQTKRVIASYRKHCILAEAARQQLEGSHGDVLAGMGKSAAEMVRMGRVDSVDGGGRSDESTDAEMASLMERVRRAPSEAARKRVSEGEKER